MATWGAVLYDVQQFVSQPCIVIGGLRFYLDPSSIGLTEIAGLDIDGRVKKRGWTLQDWTLTDNFAGVDIAGLDIEGLDIDGLDTAGLDIDGR